ncbi:MAG: hypothetical protein ACTSYI_10330, partial [Promethearchaeota archaeon]
CEPDHVTMFLESEILVSAPEFQCHHQFYDQNLITSLHTFYYLVSSFASIDVNQDHKGNYTPLP